jgi:stage II sporulation protein M
VQKGVKPLGRRHFSHTHKDKKRFAGFSAMLPQYCLIAVIILCGVIWGSVIAGRTDISKQSSFGMLLQEILSKNIASRGFLSLFLSSFFSSALILCASFVLGLCALGSPGHLVLALFKGAGIGLSMGYIYVRYGAKGFAICTLFILPWALITSLAFMIACREGIRFSFLMARAVLPSGNVPNLWSNFSNYCYRYLFCFGLVLIAALVEALSTMAFSMLFFS